MNREDRNRALRLLAALREAHDNKDDEARAKLLLQNRTRLELLQEEFLHGDIRENKTARLEVIGDWSEVLQQSKTPLTWSLCSNWNFKSFAEILDLLEGRVQARKNEVDNADAVMIAMNPVQREVVLLLAASQKPMSYTELAQAKHNTKAPSKAQIKQVRLATPSMADWKPEPPIQLVETQNAGTLYWELTPLGRDVAERLERARSVYD